MHFYISTFFIILLLISIVSPVSEGFAYTRSWSFTKGGDALHIQITPDYSSMQLGTNYTFTTSISPLAFALNQTRFSNITIQLRLVTPFLTIYSPQEGPFEFNSLSGSQTMNIPINIPSAEQLNLTIKNSLSCSFEYELNYELGYISTNSTTVSTNWATIGLINLTYKTNSNYFIYLTIFGSIIVLVLLFTIRYRRR